MGIKSLTPYLFFNGNAAEAVAFYERKLGATVGSLMRFGDHDHGCPDVQKDRVMHAHLQVGAVVLMMSDVPHDQELPATSNVHLTLDFDDEATMRHTFEALADGGTVEMAIHDTFWNAKFGTLRDRFGVSWMFNCDRPKA